MKISTKGRYALRLMLDLALQETDRPISLKDIAARQQISEKYLEQIIALLNKADYVQSIRGPQGGYRLTKDPSAYTVGMILRITEGDLAPVACIDVAADTCARLNDCVTVRVYRMLEEAISGVVDRVTLGDMVAWTKETAETPEA